jgi:hypothetical protein
VRSVGPWAVLYYVPGGGGWIGESAIVHDAHPFILQIHASSFGARQAGRNGAAFLSVACCR